VNAQATRKGNSKLRQSIQDFSLTELALVYGKKGWILTNANILDNYYFKIKDSDPQKIKAASRIFSLVERMIPFEHDEEQGSFFFDLIGRTLEKFIDNDVEKAEIIEISTVYQIMDFLGYVGSNSLDSEKAANDLEYVTNNEKELVGIINNAIQESHL
jgi:hypothetical protein